MAPPSSPLPSGRYIIENDVHNDPVGNRGPVPPVQPVVRVARPEVWFVKHVGDHHYLLNLRRFVTLPKDNYVESNRKGAHGTEWVIRERRPGLYTIIDPKSGNRGWTLNPGPNPGVYLEPVPLNVKPPQLWHFRRILRHSEEEEEEDDDEEEEEEEN